MEIIRLLTAAASIILPLVLLVIFQMSAKKGMTISFLVMIVLSYLVWNMEIIYISGAIISGVMKALTIIWILFGAIFLLNILRFNGMIGVMISGFQRLTSDKRLQLIIVGFYFVALLEGASGFGAPAAIVGPLLVILGFPPVASAALALLGNAVSMTFGAVGTPLVDGMGSALNVITEEGFNVPALVQDVAIQATFVDLFIGSFVPVVMVLLYTTLFSEEKSLKYRLETLPFAFIAGLIYTSLAYLSTVILGPEFGALLGSLIGIVIVMTLIKFNILLPKKVESDIIVEEVTFIEMVKAWSPYVLVVVLLILTRVIEPLKELLIHGTIYWHNIFNTEITAKFELFYSPGFILTLTALLVIWIYRVDQEDVSKAFFQTLMSAKKTSLALLPALAMVYIFLNSEYNLNALESMPNYLANYMSTIFGDKWVFVAPFIGNLGTFISGSTTTSNIMFTGVQYQVALNNNTVPLAFLTAQALGANTGCMISVSKVVSACAVVGLNGEESKVMRLTLGISLLYALIIGILVSILI